MPTLRHSVRLTGCSILMSCILSSLMESTSPMAMSTHGQLDLYARQFPKVLIDTADEKSEDDSKLVTATLENRILKMLLGLSDNELVTSDQVGEIFSTPTAADLDSDNNQPLRRKKPLSGLKVKRRPIQCLVNVVSCWK